MNIKYKEKYLKYKLKYFELKEMIGSGAQACAPNNTLCVVGRDCGYKQAHVHKIKSNKFYNCKYCDIRYNDKSYTNEQIEEIRSSTCKKNRNPPNNHDFEYRVINKCKICDLYIC